MIVNGTLKNANRIPAGGLLKDGKTESYLVHGQIYGDTKRRFADGEWIYTSRITEELPDHMVRTLNNFYKVEYPNG